MTERPSLSDVTCKRDIIPFECPHGFNVRFIRARALGRGSFLFDLRSLYEYPMRRYESARWRFLFFAKQFCSLISNSKIRDIPYFFDILQLSTTILSVSYNVIIVFRFISLYFTWYAIITRM